MKAIDRIKDLIISETNPEVKIITFKHAASGAICKRKGYALLATIEGNRREVLTIEPVNYSNGDKWIFRGSLTNIKFGYSAIHYAKNIHQVIKALN